MFMSKANASNLSEKLNYFFLIGKPIYYYFYLIVMTTCRDVPSVAEHAELHWSREESEWSGLISSLVLALP